MRGCTGGLVVAALLVLAPAAQAATTAEYGGGSTLSTQWGGRDTNVALRALDDGTVRYSMAATLNCPGKEESYEVLGRGRGRLAGANVDIAARKKLDLVGVRVVARWTIQLRVAADRVTGTVRLTGTRTRRGRSVACAGKADREVVLHKRGPAPGAARNPDPLATYYGVIEKDRDGTRPGIVLGVSSDGRTALVRWEISAQCDDGASQPFFNTTPRTAVRDGRLLRREVFRARYAGGEYARVRATTDVRFTDAGATGTIRLLMDFRNRRGKRISTCDSGVLRFNAFAV